eukprot:359169-Rhodomonas_salina.1
MQTKRSGGGDGDEEKGRMRRQRGRKRERAPCSVFFSSTERSVCASLGGAQRMRRGRGAPCRAAVSSRPVSAPSSCRPRYLASDSPAPTSGCPSLPSAICTPRFVSPGQQQVEQAGC